jgi:hypothetical protein
LEFARAIMLVHWRGDRVLVARTYERAVAAYPDLSVSYPHQFNAARAAALAGCGVHASAPALTDAEKARLREQAREWLGAEVAGWRKGLAGGDESARTAARRSAHALVDADFACVREQAALDSLPPAEAAAWRELWASLGQIAAAREAPR